MSPTLHLGGWALSSYAVFGAVALVAGSAVFIVVAMRRRVPGREAAYVGLAAVLGALIGARLFAALTAEDLFFGGPAQVTALRWGNMAIFGGLLGAAGAGFITARGLGLSPLRLGDAAAPAIGVGIVLLRTGCLLAGCCFGHTTDLPWGITYPAGSLPDLYQVGRSPLKLIMGTGPVHPIPIYEIVVAGLLVITAVVVLRSTRRDGTAAALMAGGYALARLVIEPLRVAEPGATPGWFDPAIYAIVVVVAAAWLITPWLRERAGILLRRASPAA